MTKPIHKVPVACKGCGTTFLKRPAEIKRSPANYCTKKCRGSHLSARAIAEFGGKGLVQDSGCIYWRGTINQDGYGVTSYQGRRMSAHMLSWVINHGAIPKGMCVCHSCDNRPCINPDHLFLGTHKDNMSDMARKGRARSKLSMRDRQFIAESGLHARELAERFNVCERAVRYWRKHWMPLPSPPQGESNGQA